MCKEIIGLCMHAKARMAPEFSLVGQKRLLVLLGFKVRLAVSPVFQNLIFGD